MPVQDKDFEVLNVPLSGRLRTAIDPTQLGEGDFQTLQNMRYGELSPMTIAGMTKINTSVINATYLKPRAGFHFSKAQPAETHVLVQAWNTGLTASVVYDNTTAIPSQGNFSGTATWTDTSGAVTAQSSYAPDNCMAYSNGKESCVWGGVEYRISACIISDLSNTIKYDYTDEMMDNSTVNYATMHTVAASIDANTMLLLHLDNNVTDSSPTTVHTVTNTGVTFSTSVKKFGTHSATFDGTTAYLTVPDEPDFDFSGRLWTVDMWVYPDSSGGTTQALYTQVTSATDYLAITLEKSGSLFAVKLYILQNGATGGVNIISEYIITGSTWTHVEVSQSNNDIYIYIDGFLRQVGFWPGILLPGATHNYTGLVYIGANNISSLTNFFKGNIDEVRVSNSSRHAEVFIPPTIAYTTNVASYLFLATTRPIQAVKFYVGTGNTNTAVPIVHYWKDGKWVIKTVSSDTTSTAGDTLATTGIITFGTTVDLAQPRLLYASYSYWYVFTFENLSATTTVYYCTVDAPFQKLVDLWDGNPRLPMSFLRYNNSDNFIDDTTNVLKEDYVNGVNSSYSDLSNFTSSSYILVGFPEKMTALDIKMAPFLMTGNITHFEAHDTAGYTRVYTSTIINMPVGAIVTIFNTTNYNGTYTTAPRDTISFLIVKTFAGDDATGNYRTESVNGTAATLIISSWNGASWVVVPGIEDNTMSRTASLGKSGAIIWNSQGVTGERKYAINKNTDLWYYYKISFNLATSTALGNAVYVDYVSGIPAPKLIGGYSFSLMWRNMLWLFDEKGNKRNSAIASAVETVCVFNGDGAIEPDSEHIFGDADEITCAATMFTRFGGSFYDNLVVIKRKEVWIVDGTTPADFKYYKVSDNYGCPAPRTLKSCEFGYETISGLLRHVLIWQAENAIVMFDGNTIQPISGDIENFFNPQKTECITNVAESWGFFDPSRYEYHWIFTSGA